MIASISLWEEVSRAVPGVTGARPEVPELPITAIDPARNTPSFAACRGEDLEGYIVVRRSLKMFGLSIGLIHGHGDD